MSRKVARNKGNPLADTGFGEVLERFARTPPGELADAIARDLVNEMNQTRRRIRSARKDIERGARTRDKRDRFRL